jgi:hypothetical protein
MAMKRARAGVEYEDIRVGKGPSAERGSNVEVAYDLFLNRGEQLQGNQRITFRIGERSVIAGLEYGVEGMRVGGERRLRVGPHLAYRDKAIAGIPAGALLEFHVTLVSVDARADKRRETPMYLRFVVHGLDDGSGRRQGLFQALGTLYDYGRLSHGHRQEYERLRAWFREHLDRPDRFARSSKTHAKKVALSWFKDSALEHIAGMRAMAQILEAHDVVVEEIRTDRPGYIVYDDEYQVAAEPFSSETPT